MDRDYSIGPDGHLSILINSDENIIHIGRHRNDSSVWPPLSIDENVPWNYLLYEPSDINDELDEILNIVAIDTDRFVYVESMKEGDVHIGVIKIELNSTNAVFLNELDSQKLDVTVDNLILSYDI